MSKQENTPEGWQWVPKKPTPAMLEEGRRYGGFDAYRDNDNTVEIYRAMLSASPSPPVTGEKDSRTTPGSAAERTLTVPFNPCLSKLREGEPFFVLLGRDKQAPEAVEAWAAAREKAEGKSDWVEDARNVANTMRTYSGTQSAPVRKEVGEEK